MPGKLYLVATPIGNLADMTPRALQTLKEADCIAAEDTRRTLQLLNHFSIKGKLIHYDENNKAKQGPVLLERLLAGENIALVTDAGFPGISDPGEAMAALAIAHGVTVVPLPGANACLTALVASGLPSTPFFFGAFLPKSKRNRSEQLAAWKNIPATVVLYEAPHRIQTVLTEILANLHTPLKDRVAVCRMVSGSYEIAQATGTDPDPNGTAPKMEILYQAQDAGTEAAMKSNDSYTVNPNNITG